MKNKHTQGPWHVGVGNGTGSVFSERGRMRLDAGATTLYPIADIVQGWDEGEDDANARLIAAAPEMLDALERLTHPMAGDDDVTHALSVIAKAKGGEA